jgi:predicted dehydrogenase
MTEMAKRPSPPENRPALRVGVVGTGLMGAMHSAAFLRAELAADSPTFSLQRIAGRNPSTLETLASRFGWREAVRDWRAVTRADDIDVVDICTPEESHGEIALDALAHGKHVFCEKPLALSGLEAKEMLDAARTSANIHMTGFVLRYWPALQAASALLDSGRLGVAQRVRARYLIDSRTLLESSLRGLGSHVLDAAMYLVGPVSSVCAVSRPVEGQPSIDAAVLALLRFDSGCIGTLELDREARGRVMDLSVSIDCTNGSLAISWNRREELEVVLDEQESALAGPQRIVIGAQDPPPLALFNGAGFGLDTLFTAQAQTLAAAVCGQPARYPDFAAGWLAAAVSDAAMTSWDSDSWVAVKSEDVDG